jgi:type I restriction enzyme S subunit
MSEWQDCTLGEYAKVLGGYAFKSSDFCGTGDFPVIKIKNVASGTLDMTCCQYISRAVADTAARFRASQGDILIAMTGSHVHQPSSMVGKVTRYSTDDIAYINQRVGKVFSKDIKKLNDDFLFYFLKWDETTYGLALSAGGSANQANIPAGQIEGLQISLPGVEEQRIIAEVLASLDDKIGLLIRQNATLEALAQAYFRQWFVEETGEDNGTLSELINVKYGKDHKKLADGLIPVYGSGGIMRYAERASYDKESVLIPRKGTLTNVIYISTPFWTVDTMFFTEMKVPNVAKFVYFFMKSVDFELLNTGSAVPSMTTEVLNNLPLFIPTAKSLEKFEKLVTPLFEKIRDNQKQISTLQKLRDTLLPKLISGEVRVKEA